MILSKCYNEEVSESNNGNEVCLLTVFKGISIMETRRSLAMSWREIEDCRRDREREKERKAGGASRAEIARKFAMWKVPKCRTTQDDKTKQNRAKQNIERLAVAARAESSCNAQSGPERPSGAHTGIGRDLNVCSTTSCALSSAFSQLSLIDSIANPLNFNDQPPPDNVLDWSSLLTNYGRRRHRCSTAAAAPPGQPVIKPN